MQTISDNNKKGIDRIEKNAKDPTQALQRVENVLDKVQSGGGIISETLHDLQTISEDNKKGIDRIEKDTKDSARALGRVEKVGGEISRRLSSVDARISDLRDAVGELQSTSRELDGKSDYFLFRCTAIIEMQGTININS